MSPADEENVSVPLVIVKQHGRLTPLESPPEGHEGERTGRSSSMRGLDSEGAGAGALADVASHATASIQVKGLAQLVPAPDHGT